MEDKRSMPSSTCGFPSLGILSRDEVVGLLVALACASACVLFLLSLPTPALADEADEVAQLAEGFAETLGEAVQAAPAPANPMPLIFVVVIMGVALAIAFVVSHSHNKPQKLGGMKGDVW